MARFVQSFYSSNAAALVTAVNTFLATLTNPNIRSVEFNLTRNDGTIGDEYTLTVRYDSAGAALGTPFLIRLDEAQSADAANVLLQAFLTANAGFFVGGTRLGVVDGEQTFKKNSLLTIYNATGGASANYNAL